MSTSKSTGHDHMRDIIDSDHCNSVKHKGSAVHGVGGLAQNQADGYEHANRGEAFKEGGKFAGKHLHHGHHETQRHNEQHHDGRHGHHTGAGSHHEHVDGSHMVVGQHKK